MRIHLLLLGWTVQLACSSDATSLDAASALDAAVAADARVDLPDATPGPVDADGSDAGPDPVDGGPAPGCTPAPPATPLDVQTRHATIRGECVDGVLRFRGVRYTAPPTGALRWAPPAAPACEPAIVEALSYGPRCPQLEGTTFVGDEDCLSLNVWTPEATGARPVLVFIHGGGNIVGSASETTADGRPLYDGALLARTEDVVLVTIQYRLGGLGFLAHESLGANGANWGLQDQVAALAWIRDNIARFGGDPRRVLIFGESAGAVNVCALLAMPSAAGLFSSALMQSGGCGQPPIAERRAQGLELVDAAGCAAAADPIGCLRAVSPEQLVRARPGEIDVATGRGTAWGPAVDGALLPESPLDAIEGGRTHDVPLVVGSNLDETFRSVAPIASCADYETLVARTFPTMWVARAVLDLYPCADYPTPRWAFVALTSDVRFICPARTIARARLAGARGATYRYFFTQRLENVRMPLGAFHGVELAFVFGNLNAGGYMPSPGEVALGEAIRGYWARFAATGDPNDGVAVSWPTYAAGGDRHLELASTLRAADGVRTAQCDGWDALAP